MSCSCLTPFKQCGLWNKCCRCSDKREVKNSKYYCQDCKKNDQYCKVNSLSRLKIDINCLAIIFAFADIRTCFCFKAGFSRSCKAKLFSPCCECSDQRSVKKKCSKNYCQSCRLNNFYWHEPHWNYISDYLNGRSSFFNVGSLFPHAIYPSNLVKELHKNGFREDTALNNTNCIRKFVSDKLTLAYITELDKFTNKCHVKFYNTQYRHHKAILSLDLYNFNENLSELNNFLIVKISYNFSEPIGYYPGYFTVSEVFPTKTKSIHSNPTIIDFKCYINSILYNRNRNELFKVDQISKCSNINNLNTALHRVDFWESKTIILKNKYQTCHVSKKFILAYITTIYTNKDYCFLKFYDTKYLHFDAFLHTSVFNFKDLLLNKRKNEFLLIKIIFVKNLKKFNVVEATPTGIKSLHPFPRILS